MSVGFGATLVPDWFAYVFTYEGNNTALIGFFNAIELVMETGFAVTAFLTLILNLILPEELDDEVVDLTANHVEDAQDEKEWERIRRPSQIHAMRKSQEMARSSIEGVEPGRGSIDKMAPLKEA